MSEQTVATVGTSEDYYCSNGKAPNQPDQSNQPKLYPRRFLILAIFCCYSAWNAFQWNQFASINDIIARQYDVPHAAVDWMSMIYMLVYIIFIFPCDWVLDQKGLLTTAVAGSFFNALGACLKLIGVGISSFWFMLFGQLVCGIGQAFILSVPARLAGVWFGPKEVSTATSVGVLGNQVGAALGFVLPPVFVPDVADGRAVREGLNTMMYYTSGIGVALFILVATVFKAKPKTPPSKAQVIVIEEAKTETYLDEIRKEMTNPGFILLFLSYGMFVGAFYAVSTTLNEVMLVYFPGEDVNIGRLGLLVVISGVVGVLLAGVLLDKTHQYKLLTVLSAFFTLALMVTFTFCLQLHKLWLMFTIAGFLGSFLTAFFPLGFEFGVEITYPLAEGTSCGLLNMSAQIFGILDILIQEQIIRHYGALAANLFICATLLIGTVFIAFVKEDLKRQAAEGNATLATGNGETVRF